MSTPRPEKPRINRGLVMLIAMWGVGALLLLTIIRFNGEADRAHRGQLVSETLQEGIGNMPITAINATSETRILIRGDLASTRISLLESIARLGLLGEHRSADLLAAALPQYVATYLHVADLVAAGRLAAAMRATDRSFRPPSGQGYLLIERLRLVRGDLESAAQRAQLRASVVSVLLTFLLLVAFSIAFARSMRARKRSDVLSREKQALLEHSQIEAATDELTGMANRRKLFEDADQALRALADGDLLSIGIFDLDGFKAYNDTFGHPAGDALLAHLGQRLGLAMDGRGTAYRLGGDEFCVVTGDRDAESVMLAAAMALSDHGERFSIGCSYGVATIPTEVATIEGALQVADRYLYGNKDMTRSGQSVQIKDALIQVIAEQDGELVAHLGRVAALAGETAAWLGLASDEIARIRLAAELHDIGKAAIPGVILDKAGPLDAAELAYMRQHSAIGERIVAAAPALAQVAPLVRSTHERPDGTGYPDGLQRDQIPIGSRVIAVVDAYDAMTTDRSYQPLMTPAAARDQLCRGAGAQFDPVVVDAFIRVLDERGWRDLRSEPDDAPFAGVSGADVSSRDSPGRRANRG